MTRPNFQLDDEVEVVGTAVRFKISQIWKNQDGSISYSAIGVPYHPASSLRLVEPMKVGDYVEVVGAPNGVCAKAIGQILTVDETEPDCDGEMGYRVGGWWYCASSLRKLSPEEVAKHHVPKDEMWVRIHQLEEFASKTTERLSAIEKRQAAICKYNIETEQRLQVLEGERPEICERDPHKNGFPVRIMMFGNDGRQFSTVENCPYAALAWCIEILDSLRET